MAKPKSKFEVRSYTTHPTPKPASPSSSTILISPTNEILLLHRVQTSSAFPSAHVFPGGNLEDSDGHVSPTPTDPARHIENLAYRTGAIRELFEETGILLARENKDAKALLSVDRETRRNGRKAVHANKVTFKDWLKSISPDAVLDTDRLLPFTHWVTPPNVPKRFTTQMYVYFVDPSEQGNPSTRATADRVETMAPEWRRASEWLRAARSGEIILFPPQFLLLYIVSSILDTPGDSPDEILSKREILRRKINDEGWKDKYISPIGFSTGEDGRSILELDKPGPELKDSGLKGDMEFVVKVKFNKEGPREVDVALRKDVLPLLKKKDVGGKGKL
jgi:8-oxo-dGTP pyrophosphatase MutT (NUDIX family)